MNKLFSKIIGASLAIAMMIGAGAGMNANKPAKEVDAAISTSEESGLVVLTSSNFDTAAEYVLKSTDGYYWNGVSGTSSSKWGGITKTLADVARVTITGTWADGFTIKDSNDKYLRATTGNMTWATTDAATFKIGEDSASHSICYSPQASNKKYGLKVNGTSGIRVYDNVTYNASTGKSVTLYRIPANTAVTGVSVSPTSVTLGVGATQQLTPTVSPNNATNKTVSYSTGDGNVASVSSTGLITAVGAGNTAITVTTQDGSFEATCSVTVTAPISVSGVSLNKDSTSLEVGETETLVATISPANASNQSIDWSSDDTDVATVANGVVTALTAGTANITATTVDGGFTATCEVTVTAPSSVTFASANNTSNSSSITISGITMTCSNCKLDDSNAYRFYSGSTLTFTSTIGKMSSIEFAGNDSSNKITNISTTVTNGSVTKNTTANTVSWSGDATSISFSLSAQGRANEIVVTLAPTVPTLSLDKDRIDLKTNDTAGKEVVATVFNVENPDFVWTPNSDAVQVQIVSTNGNIQTVKIKQNTNVAIDTSVTLTITGTDLSATLPVYITLPGAGETEGTAFTVDAAKQAIDDEGEQIAYVKGYVSQIDIYNSSYHSLTYWISDDGTTANQFEVYSGKGLNGANFSSATDLMVGAYVIIYGTIKYYESKYEFAQNSQIVHLEQVNSIALTPSVLYVTPNAYGNISSLFTNIIINQDAAMNKTTSDITWVSDNESVFLTADDEFVAGTTSGSSTKVRALIGGKEFGSATINVVNPNEHTISYETPATWSKLTSLTVGDEVVFVNEAANSEMTSIALINSTMCGNVSAYENENGFSGSLLLTVEAGFEGTGYSFKTSDNKYLSWVSGNTLTTSDEKTNASSWTVHGTFDGSDGDWKFVNVATTTRILQYNTTSPRFACYENNNQTQFQIYKQLSTPVSEHVELNAVSSTFSLVGNETDNGGSVSVDSVAIKFGLSISKADWNAIASVLNITDYGVMLTQKSKLDNFEGNSIKEAYESGERGFTIIHKGSGDTPYSNGDNYSFVAKIKYSNPENYGGVTCAAPFIVANGRYFFFNEMQYSVRSLANYYLANGGSSLSDAALNVLAGN